MADFLTAVSTKKTVSKPIIEEVETLTIQDSVIVDSAQTVLKALKNQPSHETVARTLKFLSGSNVSLVIPEPVYASIAHELVNNTLPNYWRTFKSQSYNTQIIASILRNPTGIGHLITRLRTLVADDRQKKAPGSTQNASDFIEDTLDVLDRVLSGDDVSLKVWKEIQTFAKNDIQKKLMWKEYLSQVASGRVLSIRAEAEDILKAKGSDGSRASGEDFADWLGRNVVYVLNVSDREDAYVAALVDLGSKILSLGYNGKTSPLYFATLANAQMRSSRYHRSRHNYPAEPGSFFRRSCA